ncbi:transporter [Paraburkholderia caffeinilytica]|uniref:transporter n=1 Tax=Paraburkholderia caffeinilytica TaxID=1761016 RepID=UPI003DA0CFB0
MLRTLRIAAIYVSLSALLFGLLEVPARAVDLNSQDLIPAPAGTNAMLGYFSYGDYGSFVSTNGTTYKDGTDLKSLVGIARYVRYMDIGGFIAAPQVLLPYGRLFDGSLGGAKLDSASGAGDPILALPVWFVNNPRTTFAVVPYLYIPAGSYVPGRTLNVGENRWKFDLQVGGTQQLGHGFATQLSADVMWYGNNGDATGIGTGTLRQNNTYQFQGWLTYTPPADRTWTVAAGYSKYWGGVQYLDGVANGQATRVDQIRLEVSKFVTPTFQIQGLLEHDIKVNGGFKQDLYATLRLLKLF